MIDLPPFTVIIPARYASSRLPGKPLAMIGAKPMIQHVYERALQSRARRVVVATDDQRIADAVSAFGGRVVTTATTHNSGTNRLQEAARILALDEDHIVINVQGDEPFMPAAVIDQLVLNLQQNEPVVAATLCEIINDSRDFTNPNVVKVTLDSNRRALYFSRAAIPFARDDLSAAKGDKTGSDKTENHKTMPVKVYRHIGIYAYRVGLLNRFVRWSAPPLEQCERLEQLRILYYGESIHVDEAIAAVPASVDTESDLIRARQHLQASSDGDQ